MHGIIPVLAIVHLVWHNDSIFVSRYIILSNRMLRLYVTWPNMDKSNCLVFSIDIVCTYHMHIIVGR